MEKNSDIIIVGGGVISLLSAYFLIQTGAMVTVIDKGDIGKESSWAGGGILSPLYPWLYPDAINNLSQYSQLHYQSVSEKLNNETGINPQWIESGLLMIDCDDDPQLISNWANQYKKQVRSVRKDDIQQLEAQANPEFEQAYYQDDISQIRNPWLVRSIKSYLQQNGVVFIENETVIKIDSSNKKVTGVSTESATYHSDKVVIASGAWSSLFDEFSSISVRPAMGQMILYKMEPGFLKRIIMCKGKYLIPRGDGHILCGSTIEWNGYEKIITEEVRNELQQAAIHMVPALKNEDIIKQWSGLRPASPNGVPYVDEHPEVSDLYINTGHYRYEVITGLASAQLLTDIISKTDSFVDKKDYALSAKRIASAEYITE
jgi:glycine oxidase